MINAIYKIGKTVSANQEAIDCLLKQVNTKNEKKDKNGNVIKIKNYILKIIFDLNDNKIILSPDNLLIYDPAKSNKFTYCGTNGRREKQFYLTRDMKSAAYLFGKTLNDLLDKLEAEYSNYENNALYKIAKKIVESPLYNKQNKEIFRDRIEKIEEEYLKLIPTQLIKKLVKLDRNEQIVLITPTVVDSDGETNLAETEEYKELVLTKLQLKPSKKSNNKNNFCYLCKESKPSSSNNLTKLDMKFFTTTTINSASGINKNYYDKNYRICADCLKILRAAEGFIDKNMQLKIADTQTYLIPNILSFHEKIEPDYFKKLYSKIDLAFNGGEEKFKNFVESVEYSFENDETNFSLNFLSFETGKGQYFKVINHAHDVPGFYFIKLTKTIAANYFKYEREIKGIFETVFCLGSIYRLIPIKYKKDRSLSAKKNRALLFYNQLLGENKIERDMVFSYFCEAMYHLFYMKQQNVYRNLHKEEHFDFAIKYYFYRYLVLIRTLEDLNLIDKGGEIMGETEFKSSEDIEKFLSENNYDEQRRALFYLGMLINQVGYKQWLQGHKKKPILKKISYQGMSVDDLKRLYVDVFEKLVQYGEFKYPSVEGFNTLCKFYFDKAIASWNLSEFENVFYLLSGYAYKVANTKDKSDNDNNQSTGE